MFSATEDIRTVIGKIPYRLALAGGWIDQPFISQLNPEPPGSMVVVNLEPQYYFMDRCGMGTSTRKVAARLWGEHLPDGDPAQLVRELYTAENLGKAEPSGSQDMAGLVYPGVSRLDYDVAFEDGYFPVHVETDASLQVAVWLESVLHLLPVTQRPIGYNPLGVKNLDPQWICRLGRSGQACFQAILERDLAGLGAAFNECMLCWETLLPHTVRYPSIEIDLMTLLHYYQQCHPGAMYSGCGGGYLVVASQTPPPGSFNIKVRLGRQE